MEVQMWGNGDLYLYLTRTEFSDLSKLKGLDEKVLVASGEIKCVHIKTSWQGKRLDLIYAPKEMKEDSLGLDCRDIMHGYEHPPIPIRMNGRAISRLENGEPLGSAYLDKQVHVRVR